jgi:OmpA-OmpF porin, OOP family
MKYTYFVILLFLLNSCFVSRKKYNLLKQEIEVIKSDLKDDDKDGIPNYLDLEQNTDSFSQVDNRGRKIEVVKIEDIDGDGILDIHDFCPTIKGIASANGCPDKDGDGIYDFLDKCPNAAGKKDNDGCPIVSELQKKSLGTNHHSILFLQNSTKFNVNTSKTINKTIDAIFDVLNDTVYMNYKLEIDGHTDNQGDSLKNIKLSLKRAEIIKELLVKKGINKNRLLTYGKGGIEPRVDNISTEKRKFNNRVEFRLISDK